MGNTPLGPNTRKNHYSTENSHLKIGICEMQGWRKTMVHLTHLTIASLNRKTQRYANWILRKMLQF